MNHQINNNRDDNQKNLCQEHHKEFSLFCLKSLKGLCPNCIQPHQQMHAQKNSFPELDSIENIRNKCLDDLVYIQNNYDQTLKKSNYVKDQASLQSYMISKKLDELQVRINIQIQKYFSSLKQQIEIIQQSQEKEFISQLNQMDMQIGKKKGEIDRLVQKLERGRNLEKHIVTIFTSQVCIKNEQFREQVFQDLNKIMDNLVDLYVDPKLETQIQNDLKSNLRLDIIADIKNRDNTYKYDKDNQQQPKQQDRSISILDDVNLKNVNIDKSIMQQQYQRQDQNVDNYKLNIDANNLHYNYNEPQPSLNRANYMNPNINQQKQNNVNFPYSQPFSNDQSFHTVDSHMPWKQNDHNQWNKQNYNNSWKQTNANRWNGQDNQNDYQNNHYHNDFQKNDGRQNQYWKGRNQFQ